MSAEPTFSVLIAAYNQASYVVETLDSVAAQSFTDYELVVVNDGSTDDTAEVVGAWIRAFERDHPNRSVLSTTVNGGQSAAFEHGFGLCRGRYVALLDSDDRWLPEKLAEVARAVEASPDAGMIVHPMYVIDPEGKRTGDVRPLGAKLSEGDIRETLRATARYVVPATSAVTIRADVFRRLVPMPTRGFRADADAYLTFGAALEAPIAVVPLPLADYRMHPAGHYLWRVTTVEGLRMFVDLQLLVARHFGLEAAMWRNSYFLRHAFAAEMLAGGRLRALELGRMLLRATLQDRLFSPSKRAALAAFWSGCMVMPRPLFATVWRRFQMRHTGYDKLLRSGLDGRSTLGAPTTPAPVERS